jgi:hypothetical protein
MYVNAHLEELRAEAQRNRAASLVTKRSMRERIASATASLGRTFGSGSDPVLPPLKNDPYGG